MTDPVDSAPSFAANVYPAPHDLPHAAEFTAIALSVTVDVDAVPDNHLEPISRDMDAVATRVLGVMHHLPRYTAELATLPRFDLARVQKLGDYAVALMYWHASASFSAPPKPELASMLRRAIVMRQRILHDLGALVRYDLLTPELIQGFGSGHAYLEVAHDLFGLSNLVHERWAEVGGKTLTTLEALDEATTLAMGIVQFMGDRDVAKEQVAQAVVRRHKAYTLVVRTYRELRDAMTFLRRAEGDVDRIVPSLFTYRRASKKTGIKGPAEAASNATAEAGLSTPQHSSIIVPYDTVDAGD